VKFLLTNDDGIDAPGLAALIESVRAALSPGDSILVAAPDRGRSECGHSVTTGRGLMTKRVDVDHYSVDGTPVDCVRAFAMSHGIDAVLSGVNAGANLGVDLLVSGTFAAAREAASHGIPAMAISHYRRPDMKKTWLHVPTWTREILGEFRQTARETVHPTPLWNVNLPAVDPDGPVPEIVQCEVDVRPHAREVTHADGAVTFGMNFQARPREPGRDVDQCFAGKITLSRLGFTVG